MIFAAGTGLHAFARLAATILVARSIGPSLFAPWNLLELAFTYGTLTHLGALNGLRRELPYWKGKDDQAQVERVVGVGWVLSMGPAVMVAAGLAFLLPALGFDRFVVLCLCVALLARNARDMAFAQLAADLRFRTYGICHALGGALMMATAAVAAAPLGLPALPLGFAVGYFVSWACAARSAALRPYFRFDFQVVRRLLTVGVPIMVAGLLFHLVGTIDRWFVAARLSATQLGWFTLPILVFGALVLLRWIVGEQIYPRMSFTFGESEDAGDRLGELVRVQNRATQVLLGAAGLGMLAFLPLFVRAYMPQFEPGITSAQIMCVAVWGLALGAGQENLLNAIGKQNLRLAAQFVALGVNASLITLLLGIWPQIEAVVLADAVTFLAYGIGLAVLGDRELARLRASG